MFVRCLFACFLKVWCRSLKPCVIADNGGHDPEHPVNEILAIRRYHVIYTIPYTGTQFKCRKQTVCVELDDHGMSSSKIA